MLYSNEPVHIQKRSIMSTNVTIKRSVKTGKPLRKTVLVYRKPMSY